jgi:ssDNA-binding Zn-finger/Zn-ribbon topoisomerase 1
MVVRAVAKGQYQGRQFYGCKNYPQCREMKLIQQTG